MDRTCSDIGQSSDKCLFAIEHCQLDTYVQYSKWYFCTGGALPDWIRNLGVVLLLVYLFAILGIAAFDFMCPNLRVMALHSGLSQSVLGVTFLAFANGSVDVFGAIAAMGQGNASLAVGEIMGASMFIIAVVVGTIAIYSGRDEGIKIEPRYFRRDGLFLLLATVLIGVCLRDGRITLQNSLVMLGAYCVYALMVVWDHMQTRGGGSRACSPEFIDSPNDDVEEEEEEVVNPPRNSLFSSFEYYQARLHERHTELTEIPPFDFRVEPEPDYGAVRVVPAKTPHDLPRLFTAGPSADRFDSRGSSPRPDLEGSVSPYIYGRQGSHHELHTFPLLSANTSTSSLVKDVSLKEHLFPVAAYWEDQTVLGRLVAIAMVVPILVFKATVPTSVEAAQSPLYKVYSLCIPLTAAILLHAPLTWPVLVVVFGFTSLLFGLTKTKRSPGAVTMSTAGFLMSILWVINLAGELVGALQLLAVISDINHAVLGVTVFALGDSLGDLISNVTIADQGYPTMAISACLGSPAFTMLIGIGSASLFTMLRTKKAYIEVDISTSLTMSCCTIIIVLLFLLISLHIRDYRLKWPIGVVSIAAWLLTLVMSVMFNS